ncbi:hypothetical protein [Streptomyces chiangmaiensis]|uniref:Uncharacterized protein n=1 Tax=Streptomyces chiangmaiensis TaxID=766497 RepID=A0ABU7FQV2_9ACTN|nr:hypothetical protein [Streptomyces chiangmaiensis]MED7826439.1 hypothetical protein [Streptomyces chiangmaiensis]
MSLLRTADRLLRGFDRNEQEALRGDLAKVVAAAGDYAAAEQLAEGIFDTGEQALVLAKIAEAAAAADDHDRVAELTDMVEELRSLATNTNLLVQALTALVEAVTATGDHGRAETLAHAIPEPDQQAWTLAQLAKAAEPAQAVRLIAEAFHQGRWTIPLASLAALDPSVVQMLADEHASRHTLRAASGQTLAPPSA